MVKALERITSESVEQKEKDIQELYLTESEYDAEAEDTDRQIAELTSMRTVVAEELNQLKDNIATGKVEVEPNVVAHIQEKENEAKNIAENVKVLVKKKAEIPAKKWKAARGKFTKKQEEKKGIERGKTSAREKIQGLQLEIADSEKKIAKYLEENKDKTPNSDFILAIEKEIRDHKKQIKKIAASAKITLPKITTSGTVVKKNVPTEKIPTPVAKTSEVNTPAVVGSTEAVLVAGMGRTENEKAEIQINYYKHRLAKAAELGLTTEQTTRIRSKIDALEALKKPDTKQIDAEAKQERENEEIRQTRMKALHSFYEQDQTHQSAAEDGVTHPPAVTDFESDTEEDMEAGLSTYNTFLQDDPDGFDVPSASTLNTPKSKADLDKVMAVAGKKGETKILEQITSMIPEFNNLSDGQKMLVIDGMNDALLRHINLKAIEKFNQQHNSKGAFGKIFTGARKNFLMAQFRKEELELIKGEKTGWVQAQKGINTKQSEDSRLEFIQKNIPGLIQVYGGGVIDSYLGRDGKTVIADFANKKMFENGSEEIKHASANYNEMAHILAHTPKANKESYEKARIAFVQAEGALLVALAVHNRETNASENSKTEASLYMKNAKILMETMSLAAASPETARRLSDIAVNPTYGQMFKDIIAERGLMVAGGAAARKGVKAYVYASLGVTAAAVASGAVVLSAPALGAIIGSSAIVSGVLAYYRGKQRANKTLEENAESARSGNARNAKNGMTSVGMGSIFDKTTTASGKLLDKPKPGYLTRLSQKSQELLNAASPIDQQRIVSELKTIKDFVEAKYQRNEINYGSGDQVFVNQNKLMNALHEAQVAIETYSREKEVQNIFNPSSHHSRYIYDTNNRKRLVSFGIHRADRIEQEQKAFVASQARRSAFWGAVAGSAGAVVGDFAAEHHWGQHVAEALGHVKKSVFGTPAVSGVRSGVVSGVPHGVVGAGNAGVIHGAPSTTPAGHGIGTLKGNDDTRNVVHNPTVNKAPRGTHIREAGIRNHVNHSAQEGGSNSEVMVGSESTDESKYVDEANNFPDTLKPTPGIEQVVPAPVAPVNPDEFYNKEVTDYFGDSPRVWNRIQDLPAKDYFERSSGLMSRPAREFRSVLQALAVKENISVDNTITVNQLLHKISASQAEFRSISTPKVSASEISPVSAGTVMPKLKLETVTPIATPESVTNPNLTSAQEWEQNSIKDYFGDRPRAWERVRSLNAQDYFERNTGIMSKAARLFRRNLLTYARENHIVVDKNMTVQDVMDKASLKFNGQVSLGEGTHFETTGVDGNIDNSSDMMKDSAVQGGDIPRSALAPTPTVEKNNYGLEHLNLNNKENVAEAAFLKNHAAELVNNDVISANAERHMNQDLGHLIRGDLWKGTNTVEGAKDSQIRDILSKSPARIPVELKGLYNVLQNLNRLDKTVAVPNMTVESFMRHFYLKDATTKFVIEAMKNQNK